MTQRQPVTIFEIDPMDLVRAFRLEEAIGALPIQEDRLDKGAALRPRVHRSDHRRGVWPFIHVSEGAMLS